MSVGVDAILRSVVTFNLADVSKAQNVYHYKHTTGSAQADADVVEAVREHAEAIMEELILSIHSAVGISTVQLFELVAGEWGPVGIEVSSWVGTSSGERLPSGVAMMLLAYKERSGYADKKFIPGFGEGWTNGDQFLTNAAVYGAAAAAEWITEFTSSGSVKVQAVHFNRETQATLDYSGSGLKTVTAYQRRRKPGVGLT